jgi:hypothetical protein
MTESSHSSRPSSSSLSLLIAAALLAVGTVLFELHTLWSFVGRCDDLHRLLAEHRRDFRQLEAEAWQSLSDGGVGPRLMKRQHLLLPLDQPDDDRDGSICQCDIERAGRCPAGQPGLSGPPGPDGLPGVKLTLNNIPIQKGVEHILLYFIFVIFSN